MQPDISCPSTAPADSPFAPLRATSDSERMAPEDEAAHWERRVTAAVDARAAVTRFCRICTVESEPIDAAFAL